MPISTATEQPYNPMSRQGSKMIDPLQKGYYLYSGETWTPNVNLYETATSYLVCVDLAGVDKEKIDVELTGQRLRLRGTRAVPDFDTAMQGSPDQRPAAQDPEPGPKKVRIHLMEIDHGAFTREVEMPEDINSEAITANYRNGMLWIEIPKS